MTKGFRGLALRVHTFLFVHGYSVLILTRAGSFLFSLCPLWSLFRLEALTHDCTTTDLFMSRSHRCEFFPTLSKPLALIFSAIRLISSTSSRSSRSRQCHHSYPHYRRLIVSSMSSIMACRFFVDIRRMHVQREGTTLPMTSVRSLSGWTIDAVVQDLGGDIGNGWRDGDGMRRDIPIESD